MKIPRRVWSWLLPSLVLACTGSLVLCQEDPAAVSENTGPDGLLDTVDTVDGTDSIVYSAEYIEYLIEEEKVILIGSAYATYGNVRVEAETLIFDSRNREIEAFGRPVLYDGDQSIYGDRMSYEIETGYGEITNGRTQVEKGWFEGELTRKVGKRTLEIEGGRFTTCDRTPPHYFFASKRMKVYEDEMVISEPVLMYVGEVPVFFMPYWFFPIRRGRQSGFLMPKVGTDSYDGRYVKELAYFLVLNDYSDILFSADFMENRGLRSAVEGVYIVKPYLEGKITGSYIDEMYTGRKRWRVEANHRQNMGWGTIVRARADFQSDIDYEIDYNENRIVQLNRRLESYFSMTRTWSGASLDLVVNRTENLDSEEISQLFPRVRLNISDRRLLEPSSEAEARWYNRLRASFSLLAVNSKQSSAGEETERNAGDARLHLSMPLVLLRYMNVSPSLSLRETVYGRDTTSANYPHRFHYGSSVGVNTTVYGLSGFGIGPIEALRHVLKPSVSYSFAPDPEGTYYSVPGISGVSGVNRLSASVANDFQAKPRGKDSRPVITLATLNLSASYDLRKTDRRLSDISSNIRLNPVSKLDLEISMSHDPHDDFRLTGLSATARTRLGSSSSQTKGWGSTLAGNYVRNIADRARDTYQVWGDIEFYPTEKWHVTYSQRYDLKERKRIEQGVTVVRDLHGWEGRFEWDTFGDNWRYDIRLSIKAIPEIKLGKGIFGVFLP